MRQHWLHIDDSLSLTHIQISWCSENSLDIRSLKRAREIRSQLRGYMKRLKPNDLDISTCNGDSECIRKCVVHGFFANAGEDMRIS